MISLSRGTLWSISFEDMKFSKEGAFWATLYHYVLLERTNNFTYFNFFLFQSKLTK